MYFTESILYLANPLPSITHLYKLAIYDFVYADSDGSSMVQYFSLRIQWLKNYVLFLLAHD